MVRQASVGCYHEISGSHNTALPTSRGAAWISLRLLPCPPKAGVISRFGKCAAQRLWGGAQ